MNFVVSNENSNSLAAIKRIAKRMVVNCVEMDLN